MAIQAVARLNYLGDRQTFILHSFDGIGSPINATSFMKTMRELIAQVVLNYDYIISLDGPALLAGMTVSIITGKPLRTATKANINVSDKVGFDEPGSPRQVFLYNIEPGRVLLIDDEIRTGRTVLECIKALKLHNVHVVAVIVPVGSTKFSVAQQFNQEKIPLLVHEWHDQ